MRTSRRLGGGGRRTLALACGIVTLVGGTAVATHLDIDTNDHTTVDQTIVPAEATPDGYTNLTLGPGEPYVVRDAARTGEPPELPVAEEGRETRRASLAYFSQMTDFQLADEESPARVEFVDPGPSSAWRPQEGMTPFQVESTIRQINNFADASPVTQGDGTRNAMDFGLLTGDQADNQHYNETVWVRDLLEGNGPTNFNSGLSNAADYADPDSLGASCALYVGAVGADEAAAEGARYTGVQDYDDYPLNPPPTPLYYDPDEPTGPSWEDWPEYDGLMDRAQQIEVDPEGLAVPFYVTNGNHDVLVQGNEDGNQAFEDIATGCFKALGTTLDPTQEPPPPDGPDPNYLLSPANVGMLVPPDPSRRLVSKLDVKEIYGATDEGPDDDDHGFSYVDPEELEASNGSASYYGWDPPQTPGMRFISIDTNSEGGQTAESFVPGQPSTPGSSNGNIDDPQFQWLQGELEAARERNQLVVIFGHHPVRSLNTEIRDEQAAACTVEDDHGHDVNPGCDVDPRPSDGDSCIHNGTDAQNNTCDDATHVSFVELMDQFPNVVAYVPGHTHEHRLTPFARTDGSTWWEINTSAVIDYPNQSRLVELMDNRDGTLSIFNTVVDHAAPATAPEDCPDDPDPQPDCAVDFTEPELASIGRTFSYNDPDNDFSGAGRVIDRNAELLTEDPRPEADLSITKIDELDPVTVGELLTYTLTVANAGPGDSVETRVTDELPAGVTIDSVSPTRGTCTTTGSTVQCELGRVAAGSAANVAIRVIPQREGDLTNTARVSGNVGDRNPANDSATETTRVRAATSTAGGAGGAGNNPPGSRPGANAGCVRAAAFGSVAVAPRGRRVGFDVNRRSGRLVRVDVFQTSIRRRVLRERLVARFSRTTDEFTWSGRANRPGRRVRDGVYFVRLRGTAADGQTDVRRVTLQRKRGRWSKRPAFYQRLSCGLLSSFKLGRPVFGGRNRRSLGISYRLSRRAQVSVAVLRGTRVVKRYRQGTRAAGVTHRLRFSARGRRRGDYRVRVTATDRGGRSTRTLVARRL